MISSKRILIVDDDPAIVESLHFVLEDSGYSVDSYENGNMLEKSFKSNRPDLILMDYLLPGDDGCTLTKKIKQKKEIQNIPVIIMSASYNIQDLVAKSGADGFLAKPYDIDQLLETIEKYVK